VTSDIPNTPDLTGIREVTGDEVAFYQENGWACLRGLLSQPLVDELLRRAREKMGADARSPLSDNRGLIMSPQLQAIWQNWQNPALEDPYFAGLSMSTPMGRIASRMMGDRPVRFWSDTILVKLPAAEGGAKTPWHQDFPYHAMDRAGILNIWVALVDVPPEMGALRFLSGSHRLGPMGRVVHRTDGLDLLDLYPTLAEELPMSEPLHLAPGDATVHSLMTVHYAPENVTDKLRWAYLSSLFPADTLFTGAQQRRTDGLGLTVNQPFDHPLFPEIRL
jgi:hypothetical protein